MYRYIVEITKPRFLTFLTSETSVVVGAKNVIDLLGVILKYRNKYAVINIRVQR